MKPLLRSALTYAVIFIAITSFSVSDASVTTVEIVKVYSEGKLIATYEASEKGQMDGDCYVFKIRKGARNLNVRVCGTFIVEEAR